MRSLTLLESALGVALGGAVLATTVPAFLRNLHASRLAEPLNGLERLAGSATALAASRVAERAYPPSAPLTPAQVPRGEAVVDPEGTWQHPTWVRLDFSVTVAHWFSFAFESTQESGEAHFVARAHGDLDGDGVLSTFTLSGLSRDGDEPVVLPLEMRREVE